MAIRIRKIDGCTCQCCGITYKTDIIISDILWVKINPTNKDISSGLLCPICIVTKLEMLNEFSAYKLEVIK